MTEQVKPAHVFDAGIFLQPFHIVRLGYLTHFETSSTLTVGDYVGGKKLGMKLTPEHVALLSSLDPTVNDREFVSEHLGLITWMAEQGFLLIVKSDADAKDLNIVPVPRREVNIDKAVKNGYRVLTNNGEPFIVTELGVRLLSAIDGQATLGEIVEGVKQAIINNPEEQLLIAKNEKESGKSFDLMLLDEALALIKATLTSRALSYEPKP